MWPASSRAATRRIRRLRIQIVRLQIACQTCQSAIYNPVPIRQYMSIRRVERDLNRFRQIVRGKIKKDLRKYMSQGEMIGRQGRKYVSIPLPQIDLPQFRYGAKQGGGVGQGDGDVGEPIGRGDPQQGEGEAGSEPGPACDRGRYHARRAGRRFSAKSFSCRMSSRAARRISSRRRTSTPAFAESGPMRCATSSAPTARRSSAS